MNKLICAGIFCIMFIIAVVAMANYEPEAIVVKRVPMTNTNIQMRIVKVHQMQQFSNPDSSAYTVRPLEVADEHGTIRMIFDFEDTFIGKPKAGDRIFATFTEITDHMGRKVMYALSASYLIGDEANE